jgi:small-conductance mechanosensitive channel
MTHPLFWLGATPITPLTLLVFVALAVAGVVLARLAASLVGGRLLARTGVDAGLRYALGRITYYVLLVVGLLIALQTAGVQVGSLTVVLGALGVGIGFGLQNIVNNFVSGLILLIERPVNVGDWIEVQGTGARVERIGARSTTIVTNDHITIIVPNAELITNRIINWSHGDARVRLRLPVGVAYGSDLDLVRETLIEVARANAAVLGDPPPLVNFIGFGESAFEFELAVWTVTGVQRQRGFRSDLNFAIAAACRAGGIEMPVPQRDLHVRGGTLEVRPGGSAPDGR